MKSPETLLDRLKVPRTLPALSNSVLIIVDAQREYVDGSVPLFQIGAALLELKALLERARKLGVPIFHLVHHAPAGAAIFDPEGQFVQIADPVKPVDGEPVIIKHYPSGFAQTDLQDRLTATKRSDLIIGGFMTHMCISATARSANELGFRPTVVASACATRDLPNTAGAVISATTVHQANLASLADLVATVASAPSEILD